MLATVLGTLAALGLARLPRLLRSVAGGADPVAADRAGDRRGDRHLLRLLALRPGRHAGSAWCWRTPASRCPFVVTSVGASLAGFDRRLEQAALSLGATPWGTFRQVTLPLIRPGVLVGALFAFITSFDELIVALFLSGSGAVTLPRRMWDDLRFAIDPTIAAVSTLTIVLTALLLAAVHFARQRGQRVAVSR